MTAQSRFMVSDIRIVQRVPGWQSNALDLTPTVIFQLYHQFFVQTAVGFREGAALHSQA
jgi:hypothetical protein